MSVLDDIMSGWGTKKTQSSQDVDPTQPPQVGSVAKQVVNEYDASLNNPDNATVKGIVPTVNSDGTINVAENRPVYNVKDNPVNTYRVAPVQTQPTETSPTTTSPVQDAYKSSVDQFINNYVPESDKQKEQREKRERRNKIFTSVADGIGALANIIGGVNGAKNANPHGISMTKAYQDRLDHLRQLRKENEQRYIYYLQKKEEDRRRDEANDWDRTKFVYDQNFKIGESERDQANKDRDYDRYVNKDKEDANFKKLDAEYKEKQFKEEVRSHRATEGLSAERNQISREKGSVDRNDDITGPNIGQGVTRKNAKSIVLPGKNGTSETYYYNRNLNQALVGHKQDMLQIAQKLSQGNNGRAYRDIYYQLRNARTHDETLNIIVSNMSKFPQLSEAVKKTLGIGTVNSSGGFNIESYKANGHSKNTTKSQKPPLN